MKVFCCRNQWSYGLGLILVAANTREEAYFTAVYDDRTAFLFYWVDDYVFCGPDGNTIHYASDTYPLWMWYEVEHLTANLSEPQIIIEDHYSE